MEFVQLPACANKRKRTACTMATTRKTSIRKAHEEKAARFIAALSESMTNMGLHGPDHGITTESIEETRDTLLGYLAGRPVIAVGMAENVLTVDDFKVSVVNPLVRGFARQMNALKLSNFSVKSGVTNDELSKFVQLLLDDKDADKTADRTDYFRRKLVSGGFSGVEIQEAEFRPAKAGTSGPAGDAPDAAQQSPDRKPAAQRPAVPRRAGPTASLAQVVSYLRGRPHDDTAGIDEEISIASHARGRLSQLIAKAAVLNQNEAESDDTRSLAEHMVTGLKQTAASLRRHSSFETKDGKQRTAKVLAKLEAEILERIRQLGGDTLRDDVGRISTVVEDLSQDVSSSALIAEYSQRRKALNETEGKIAELIADRDAETGLKDKLREKLAAEEMTPEDWDRLIGGSQA